ncbi:hypothetical protein BR10RB9215_C10723 [Brucella sp. 10RB9215]|nr:hypothetical protein BR10RB9215_C10723 [Brucella sp. 10RB9215]
MQQEAVAASHHFQAVRDQSPGLVLPGIDFPILLGPAKAEQHFGDGAIAFAPQASVERAQGKDMKPAKLRGHGAEVCAWRSPIQGSPEATRSMGAKLHVGIHRKGYGIKSGCVGHGLGQPELMRDAIDMPDAMPSVRRVP